MQLWFTGAECFTAGPAPLQTAIKHIFHAGRQARTQTGQRASAAAELTSPSTSGVSMPLVSFTLCGWDSLGCGLDCGFSCLFSSRGTIFVPCSGSGATSRFCRSGQSATLRLFSLIFPRPHQVCPGMGFSVTAL